MARIILASTSPTRMGLLKAAGVPFEAMAPGIDERAVEAPLLARGADAAEIAQALAEAKAGAVSARVAEAHVIGADQTLSCEGRQWHKPKDRAEARDQLLSLSGRTHELQTGLAGARRGRVVWHHLDTARLTMRRLTPDFVDDYLAAVGEAALGTVGAYSVEGRGIQLFERIEGSHFTILGLTMIPLLSWLRAEGAVRG
jgi:septum formation protein